MIFGKKKRDNRKNWKGTDGKSEKLRISEEMEAHDNDPVIDPVSAYLSLLSGEKPAWKQDEDAKKEFYRFKYEHEQILCGFAAGVFEYYRKQRQPD